MRLYDLKSLEKQNSYVAHILYIKIALMPF